MLSHNWLQRALVEGSRISLGKGDLSLAGQCGGCGGVPFGSKDSLFRIQVSRPLQSLTCELSGAGQVSKTARDTAGLLDVLHLLAHLLNGHLHVHRNRGQFQRC
jgi:hypothetical protein